MVGLPQHIVSHAEAAANRRLQISILEMRAGLRTADDLARDSEVKRDAATILAALERISRLKKGP